MRPFFLALLAGVAFSGAACGHDAGHDAAGHGATQGNPTSVAISAVTTDAVYVVNGEDSSISVLDARTGSSFGTIRLENVVYPHHVYLSPDRTKLAVAVPGHDLSMGHSAEATGAAHGGEHATKGGVVFVLDAATGATIKARRLDAPNHNAIFSPNGAEIWTAQLADAGKVLVLDATTLDTKQEIAVGRVPAEVTFTPDGKYAFVANGTSNDVTVIDVTTKGVVTIIPVDREPVGAWPGADGRMYVDCEVAKTVKVIDPAKLEVVETIVLGYTPGFASVPPTRLGEVWVTDADSGKVVLHSGAARAAEVSTGAGAHALAFTPDGATAFVTNQLAGSVSIVDAATRTVKSTVPVGKKPNGMVYRSR